jgi:hypothetical protein
MPALSEPDVISRGHGVCTSYGWGPSSKTFIIRDADIRNEDPFGISHNVSHVCDVALSPTRARGHVAERRAAAPRSPRHPEGVPMHIRAVMCSCAIFFSFSNSDRVLGSDCLSLDVV